jgi:hypothetical protein
MTIFRFKSLLGALAFLGAPLQAQEGVRADRMLSVRDLHGHCAESEATEAGRLSIGYCLGTITGIADASMTLNAVLAGKQTICLESDDTAEKMRLLFLKFVERRSDVMDMPAATVVIAVLRSNFPCEVPE